MQKTYNAWIFASGNHGKKDSFRQRENQTKESIYYQMLTSFGKVTNVESLIFLVLCDWWNSMNTILTKKLTEKQHVTWDVWAIVLDVSIFACVVTFDLKSLTKKAYAPSIVPPLTIVDQDRYCC